PRSPAGVAESADAGDLKSLVRKDVPGSRPGPGNTHAPLLHHVDAADALAGDDHAGAVPGAGLGGVGAALAETVDDAEVVDPGRDRGADGAGGGIGEDELTLRVVGVRQPAAQIEAQDLGEGIEALVDGGDAIALQGHL